MAGSAPLAFLVVRPCALRRVIAALVVWIVVAALVWFLIAG